MGLVAKTLAMAMLMRGTVAAPELWRGMLQLDATAQWMDVRGVSKAFLGLLRGENIGKMLVEVSPPTTGG